MYSKPLSCVCKRDFLSGTGDTVFSVHAGTFYLIWGLWWMLMSFWAHIKEPQADQHPEFGFAHGKKDPFTRKSWIPQPCYPRIPLEPIIKILLPSLGIFVETFLDMQPDAFGHYRLIVFTYRVEYDESSEQYVNLNRLYHISLYLAFVISGVVDLLSLLLNLPSRTSQLFLCFALYCQSLLFYMHIGGRRLFNIRVHQLLLVFVIATAIFSTLRLFNPRNLLINSGLAGGMILQGTNLIQAGSLLYGGRKWNPYSHNNPKFIAAVTTWHLLGTGLLMIFVFVAMRVILIKYKDRVCGCTAEFEMNCQHTGMPEKERLINHATALRNNITILEMSETT